MPLMKLIIFFYKLRLKGIHLLAETILYVKNEFNNELALYDLLNISKNVVHDTSTDIYKYSNFIKSLQFISDIHVIRRWSDDILNLNDNEFVKSLVESKLIETGNSE